jgi:AcrR family transcriptional regulator
LNETHTYWGNDRLAEKRVRIPQQKRAIEKKEKIIEAADRVFSTKGYFGTTTADIATEAAISVGTVYAYFKNKKDILMTYMNRFGENLIRAMEEEFARMPDIDDFSETAERMIDITVRAHESWRNAVSHDEIVALQYRDRDVADYFIDMQRRMEQLIGRELAKRGYALTHPHEQIYLIFHLVDDLAESSVFHHRRDLDYSILSRQVALMITQMIVRK